jgi:predicted nuclease of predicted toxin-antitoxin system
MNLVLDQGLPRSAARMLRALGHRVVHVGDVGMSRALDEEILAYALSHGGTVVTLDADFHALLAQSGAAGPSVIRLRVQGKSGGEISDIVVRVLRGCGKDLEKGAIATADEVRVRVRRLPMNPERTE